MASFPRNAITIALDSDVITNEPLLRAVESCFAAFYLLDRLFQLKKHASQQERI